jgi:hypothetical protein
LAALRLSSLAVVGSIALTAAGTATARIGSTFSATAASEAAPSVRVGAFYFDGWSGSLGNFHFDGLVRPSPNGQFPERRPLSGWQDDTPDALQAQLRWAHEDGIGFFIFDWYYNPDPGNGPINMAHDMYLKLGDHDGVGFALLYVNQGDFAIPPDQWAQATDQWVTNDFLNRAYIRIAGKPVLIILDTTGFRAQWSGNGGVNTAIATLQDAARRHGLPGVFVVGVRYTGWANIQCFPTCDATDGGTSGLVTEHYDALTDFSYPWIVQPVDGPRPYSDVVNADEAAWDFFAQKSPFPYVPSIMDGWDPRPWNERYEGQLLEWFVRTPGEVGAFLNDGVMWVERHPNMRIEPAPAPPVVLVQSWNELGEGAYVLPTDGDGYSYGQALAQAVGISWIPPPKRSLRVSFSHGSVTSSPAGISCSSTCAASFDEGTQVTLTARPRRGFLFDHWSGCTKTDPTCSVVLVQDAKVTAVFLRVVQRRRLSLRFTKRFFARGRLTAVDGFSGCASGEPVQIQRFARRRWVTIASTQTNTSGGYAVRIPDRRGRYRSDVRPSRFLGHTCLATSSRIIRHVP